MIGVCQEVQKKPSGSCLGIFMRVRVLIDITKPLRRGVKVQLGDEGKISWAYLQYERLPNFCYRCGKFGHVLRECSAVTEVVHDGNEESMYRDCLKASGLEISLFRRRGAWRGSPGWGGARTGERGSRNGRETTPSLDSRWGSRGIAVTDLELIATL